MLSNDFQGSLILEYSTHFSLSVLLVVFLSTNKIVHGEYNKINIQLHVHMILNVCLYFSLVKNLIYFHQESTENKII